MTLLQLQYFSALARNCHFTRTAEEMHVSQPTLSHAIRELEKELEGALFERKGGRVEMTDLAQEFLPYVLSAMQQLDKGIEQVRNKAEQRPVPVRLTYIHSLADTLIPKLIREFRISGAHEKANFYLEEAISETGLRRLRSGKTDMAFTTLRGEGVSSEAVWMQPLSLAVSRDHPLAGHSEVCFEDFRHEQMIAFLKPSHLREQTDRMFDERGSSPQIAFEVRDSSVAYQYVALSLGVAVLPESMVYDREHVILLPIRDTESIAARPVYLSWLGKEMMSREAAAFLDFVLHRKKQEYT